MAASVIRELAEKDPHYRPYCLRCPRLWRMMQIMPFFWRCEKCGAEHDERAELT